jgi:hypothetical protein
MNFWITIYFQDIFESKRDRKNFDVILCNTPVTFPKIKKKIVKEKKEEFYRKSN